MFVGGCCLLSAIFPLIIIILTTKTSPTTTSDIAIPSPLTAAVSAADDWSDRCPTMCQCKWISGKKSAICRDANFTIIPASLNSDVQLLDLGGNRISQLGPDAFLSVGLIHLHKVFMKDAGLQYIHKDAFRQLTILVDIDLSDNFVSDLHEHTFSGNNRLRAIYMNGNPLTKLKSYQFPKLPHLKSLEFQHCRISQIDKDAFINLSALELISLDGNRLHSLSESLFLPLPHLKTLMLDGNPWMCDCHLRHFRNWLLDSKLYSHPLVCTRPEFSMGKHWENVESEQFACAPNATTELNVVQANVGGNVTLSCSVYADPEPTITWMFNGHIFGGVNESLVMRDSWYYIEEEYMERKGGQKLSSIVLLNISENSAGEYTCRGSNLRGDASVNVSVNLPKEAVATTMKKDDKWIVPLALIITSCGAFIVISALFLITVCHLYRWRCRRNAASNDQKKLQRNKMNSLSDHTVVETTSGILGISENGTISFHCNNEGPEKKLLDVAISNTKSTDTQRNGASHLGFVAYASGSASGSGDQLLIQEDHPIYSSGGEIIPLEMRGDQPVHITIESHAGTSDTTPLSLYHPPPPPEFSSTTIPAGAQQMTTATFGNIFISVSVGQEPIQGSPASSSIGYPDLIDITRKGDTIKLSTASSMSPQRHQHPIPYFATLPRRSLHQQKLQQCHAVGSTETDPGKYGDHPPQPIIQCNRNSMLTPKYDNMGPRITADGSSTFSLPDSASVEEIPQPPPLCTLPIPEATTIDMDYISL